MNLTPPVDTDWMLNFGYAALEELAKNSGAEPGAELTLIIYDATAARIPSPGDTIHAWVVACTTHGFVPALVGPPEFVAFDHWNIHASEEEPPPTSDALSPTDPTADPGSTGSADADSTEPLPLDDGGASDEGSVGSSPADLTSLASPTPSPANPRTKRRPRRVLLPRRRRSRDSPPKMCWRRFTPWSQTSSGPTGEACPQVARSASRG